MIDEHGISLSQRENIKLFGLLIWSLWKNLNFLFHGGWGTECQRPSEISSSTPQLPFKIPHIPSNRDHKALNRGVSDGKPARGALPVQRSNRLLTTQIYRGPKGHINMAILPSGFEAHASRGEFKKKHAL